MADHHAPLEEAVLHHIRPCLAEHLPDGRRGRGEVVRCGGQPCRQRGVSVFQVRQVHVRLPLQQPQRLHRLIAAAVIHHRHRQLRLQRRQDPGQEVGGRYQIDVVGALSDQFLKDLPQPSGGDGPAEATGGDLPVLAIAAPQGAAGEKHRAAAPRSRQGRLLPQVQGGPGHAQPGGHTAEAVAFGFRSFRAAAAGTQRADHFRSRWKSGPRSPAIQWRRHRPMYRSLAPSTTCAPSFTT